MDSLKRNQTTAAQANMIEEAKAHPLRRDKQHSAAYFEILEQRRKLPVSEKRQEFLDSYHSTQFGHVLVPCHRCEVPRGKTHCSY